MSWLLRKREEEREHIGRRKAQVYCMLKEGPDFTCNVLLGDKKVKGLVDTGPSVSLVSSKVFRQLGLKMKLSPVDLLISQADSNRMRI